MDANHLVDYESVLAHCWILTDSADTALNHARFKVQQYGWQIDSIEAGPEVVDGEMFAGKDLGLEHYTKAQESGSSFAFLGVTDNEEILKLGASEINLPREIDLHASLVRNQETLRKGHCMHFDSGDKCDEIINAHTIQKSGILRQISQDGVVYAISTNLKDISRNQGHVCFKKKSINKFSTFRGFCGKHDNELFRKIDDNDLEPTNHQIFLYAYRALCRELFLKECSLYNFSDQREGHVGTPETGRVYESMIAGNRIAIDSLKEHKKQYDESLVESDFDAINYVLFYSKSLPNIVFSGGLFPDFGFDGEFLQDLVDRRNTLDYITFFFAPCASGWALGFAWHQSSWATAHRFTHSLQKRILAGDHLGDVLFNFVFKCCENTAIKPLWWESLKASQKKKIEEAAMYGLVPHAHPDEYYLKSKVEVPHQWDFSIVKDRMIVPSRK